MYARKTVLIIGSAFFSQLLGLVAVFFIANRILPENIGMVGLAIGLISIFGIVTDLGYSTAHIKRISEGMDIGRCMGTYVFIKVVLMAVFIPLSIFGTMLFKMAIQRYSDIDMSVVYLLLVWSTLSTMSSILTNTYMGRQEMAKAQTVGVVSALVQAVATIIIVLRTNEVLFYAGTWVIGAAASLFTALMFINGTEFKLPSKEYLKSYTRYALPMTFVIAAAPIILQLNPVMIGFFKSNEDVALFVMAIKFATVPEFLSNALIVVLFPAFSMMAAAGMMDRIKNITKDAERYLSMVLVPPTFLFMAIATPFLVIFTQPFYGASGFMLSLLMVWVLLKSLSKPFLVHFGGMDRPIYSSLISMITLPLVIVLNLVFIPDSLLGIPMLGLGADGAAIAALISAVISYVIVRYLSNKLIPMGVNMSVVKHLIAGTVMAISVHLLEHFIYAFDRWYGLIIYCVIGMGVYLVLIYLMGEFKRKDILFFFDALNARKMFVYISKELRGRS